MKLKLSDRLKKFSFILFLSIITGVISLFTLPFVFHLDSEVASATKNEEDVLTRIKELQAKLDRAQNQASSLSREINIIESKLALKEAQIHQAELEIVKKEEELAILKEDIRLIEIRLSRLDDTIDEHEKLLAVRLKEEYVSRQDSFIEVVLSTKGIADFITKLKYLKRIQQEDKELLTKMNDTKDNYEDQQTLLEEKKNEVEKIKADIENQKAETEKLKASLEVERSAKDSLLRVTKNDEKRYQELLESAKKELAQIQNAAVVVREGNGVDVEDGEVIGTMGNSGFSTGAHLHFSIYKYDQDSFQEQSKWGWYYSNYVNPLDYLKPKEVLWATGCYRDPKGNQKSGKGDYTWPMSSPRITQSYGGATCYNWMYGGKVHPALDMVGIGDISIRSVADGEAYFCRNCLGDGGNGVFIFHENKKMSVYWHLK